MTIDWKKLGEDVAVVADAIAPLFPTISTTIIMAGKIVEGTLEGIPAAMDLYDTIIGGKPVSAESLAAYASDYEAAYQKLNADIAQALAAQA